MSVEYRHHWGEDPRRSQFIVTKIDHIASIPVPSRRMELTIMYRHLILDPLRKDGIDPDLVDRLRISFLDPDKRPHFGEIRIPGNDELSVIKVKIFDILGMEVLTRLDLSLTPNKPKD